VDCALLRRKDDPSDQTANARLRQMLRECQSPAWCQEVIVVADAAYASRDHLASLQELRYPRERASAEFPVKIIAASANLMPSPA
jgi:hypothetical protein